MSIENASPRPWRVSDAHGLCIADKNGEIVADLVPRGDWAQQIPYQRLKDNAELIVAAVNDYEWDKIE